MRSHSLLTSERPLTHVAAEHGTMRRRVTMLLHCFLAAEAPLALVTCVSAAESCVVGACVILQCQIGTESFGANGTLFRHGEEGLMLQEVNQGKLGYLEVEYVYPTLCHHELLLMWLGSTAKK